MHCMYRPIHHSKGMVRAELRRSEFSRKCSLESLLARGHTAGFTGCPAVLSLLAEAFQINLAASVSHGISMLPQTA